MALTKKGKKELKKLQKKLGSYEGKQAFHSAVNSDEIHGAYQHPADNYFKKAHMA